MKQIRNCVAVVSVCLNEHPDPTWKRKEKIKFLIFFDLFKNTLKADQVAQTSLNIFSQQNGKSTAHRKDGAI